MTPAPRRRQARRIEGIAQSDIRKMSRICMELGGVNLGQGICDQPTPPEVKVAAKAAIDADQSIYSKYEGIDPLRAAIARKLAAYNGLPCDPDSEVLVTAGSTGGFVAAALSFIEEGDEVILFSPFYGYHLNVLKLARPVIRSVTLRGADWAFDRGELAAAFGSKAKAIVINTPCNPCGKVFTREELEFIAGLCVEHDCLAITDEIYEYILYDGRRHVSLATLPGMRERTITLSGFSKTYNMTGWRLGYSVAPAEFTAPMGVIADLLYICAPTPLQHGVLAAFDLPESYYRTMQADYDRKRAQTMAACDAVGLRSLPPQGSYYLMVDVREAGFATDREAADVLMRRCGVATVPGSSFYVNPQDGATQLRICFAKQDHDLDRACEGIAKLAKVHTR
ncbi:MAG TPA: aminotransferase class I/II-fold pyridoxal phosphate-dependent enzyme [Planctomycetota bacterium]|nr:aminotransferase class I/II-fold pyridoxal phosphate-dependent enzyme [Planctomycetota bacterium]